MGFGVARVVHSMPHITRFSKCCTGVVAEKHNDVIIFASRYITNLDIVENGFSIVLIETTISYRLCRYITRTIDHKFSLRLTFFTSCAYA